MKASLLGFAIILLVASPLLAAHNHQEKYYQNKWCAAHHGQAEVVIEDQTMADCQKLKRRGGIEERENFTRWKVF